MTDFTRNKKFDNSNLDRTAFENCEGLILKVCKQVNQRANSAGVSFDFDDLYQDACVVWVNAKNNFDPNSGNLFSTYLMRALYNDLNRRFKNKSEDVDEFAVSYNSESNDDEAALTLDSIVKGSHESIESQEIAYESLEELEKKLSPFARLTLRNFITPPEQMVNEFNMLRKKAEHSIKMGHNRKFKADLDLGFVASFLARMLGKNESFAIKTRREIESKAKYYLA